MDENRLGTLLLESRLVGEEELARCLEIQALTGGSRPLGRILQDQGLIDGPTLARLLQLQEERTRQQPSRAAGSTEGSLLKAAVGMGANELVVSEGRLPLAKVGGRWSALGEEPLRGPHVWDFVRTEMGNEVLEQLADRASVVQALRRPGTCRGRIAAFRHFDGVAVTVRLHPDRVRTPAELGLPPALVELVRAGKSGLLLVLGRRGSGRSEVLATLTGEAGCDPARSVWVLDEVAEFPLPEPGAMVVRRRPGRARGGYAEALRATLREDPDVVLVADVGEPGAFDLALRAAEGGRLVVGAMHAASIVEGLQRAIAGYPTRELARARATLATTMLGAVCRNLLPAADGNGLVPAVEHLVPDEAVRDLLRQGELQHLQLVLRMVGGQCGRSLDQSLQELLASGRIDFADAFACADQKGALLAQAAAGRE